MEEDHHHQVNHLPEGIVEDVLSRLPAVKVIGRCMLLSKQIYKLITSNSFYRKWIGANLQQKLMLFFEGDEAVWNSIGSIDLRDFDQPHPPPPQGMGGGLVDIPTPLAEAVWNDKIFVRGCVKGILLLEIENEEEVGSSRLQIWNPFRRLFGPLSLEARVLTMGSIHQWTSVRCPFQLPPGSVLSHITTNDDIAVLWTVKILGGFSFETNTFIPLAAFPVWADGDGDGNFPILKILGGKVYAYRAAAGCGGGAAHPVVLYRFVNDNYTWAVEARFNLMYDLPEVDDTFEEVVTATHVHPRLFLYTSGDHLIGYDPGNRAYFFFGEEGLRYGAIQHHDDLTFAELQIVAYQPSFFWPYPRFAGEDNGLNL